jgi:S-DNA-T family DNA segregation ATPase FtsK/SpoIIIE
MGYMGAKNGRKNGRKKNGKEKEELPGALSLNPETKRGLATLFLLVLAVLFTLSAFGLAGALGGYLSGFNHGLLGLLYPLLPLFLFFLALSRLFEKSVKIDTSVKLGAAFFILALASLIHLIISKPEGVVFGKRLAEGGGYIGMLLSYLLEQGTGFWGAAVILGAGLLASLLLLFKTSLQSILAPHRALTGMFKKQEPLMTTDSSFAEATEDKGGVVVPPFAKKDLGLESSVKGQVSSVGLDAPSKPRKHYRKIALPLDLLTGRSTKPQAGDIKAHQHIIQKTLENFGVPCEMGAVSVGPTVTQYTLKPADGVKLSRITALNNDLALALAAHPIRIEAPIPGKSLVGIEVPNQAVAVVPLRDVLDAPEFRSSPGHLRIALGMDVAGKPWLADLTKMPHMLVAGSTGSGKTVCLNTIIISLLYTNGPEELKLLLVDPKRVELPIYNNIPHLLVPAVTELNKTVNALKWALGEMDRRFNLLSKFGKRDIGSYNEVIEEKMPYIVVVIDELADLMVSNMASEVEACIIRLAQMARAVGIHLIIATQRPSVDIITGLIKANFPTRAAFAVASGVDSRTILDSLGAEKLVGRGDMLYLSSEMSMPKRLQGAFVSDKEIRQVVDFIKDNYDAPDYQNDVVEKPTGPGSVTVFGNGDGGGDDDPLLPDAKDVILRAGKASASLLQRRLKVGYARAARILDLLEEQGVIGPGDGAKPRDILIPRPADMEPIDLDAEEAGEDEESGGTENGIPKWE